MITDSLQVGILATYCLVSLVLPVDPTANGQPRLAAAPFPLSPLLQTNLQQRWVMFRSSVRSNCLCLMHLLFPQPPLLEFVLFTDSILCAHKQCRCSVGLTIWKAIHWFLCFQSIQYLLLLPWAIIWPFTNIILHTLYSGPMLSHVQICSLSNL